MKSTFSKDKKKADTASLEKYGLTVKELEKAINAYEGMIKDTREAVASGLVGADMTSSDSEIFGSVAGETENTAGTNADGERKYDLKRSAALMQSIGNKSVSDFSSSDIQKAEVYAKKYNQEMGTKSPFFRAWFGDWRAEDKTPVNVVKAKGAERRTLRNADTEWDIQVSGKVFSETNHISQKVQQARPYLDYMNGIVENAVLLDTYAIPASEAKSENSALMHSLYAICDAGNGPEILKLYVEELDNVNGDNTIKRAYQLQNLEVVRNQQSNVRSSGQNPSSIMSTADIKSIADLFGVVKSLDSKFNPNESSKVVNSDGTPRVVYHQTKDRFSVFENGRANAGKNDSESHAGQYGKVRAYYLDINMSISEISTSLM